MLEVERRLGLVGVDWKAQFVQWICGSGAATNLTLDYLRRSNRRSRYACMQGHMQGRGVSVLLLFERWWRQDMRSLKMLSRVCSSAVNN